MNIQIFVSCHTPYLVPKNSLLHPVQVGVDLTAKQFPKFLRDNSRENISAKNQSYYELTTQYLNWKNVKNGGKHFEKGLISVIMGVRYRRKSTELLERAVESILCQSYERLEFLICFRESTAQAMDYLYRCEKNDNRIILIDGSSCGNFQQQLNLCLQNAKGSWIARMDDDDFSFPNRLQIQLDFLRANPEISFVGCNVNLCYSGRRSGERQFPPLPQVRDFLITQPFIHPTLLFRRDCLEAVGGYGEDSFCVLCEDYDLLLRLYEKGFQGANIQQPLFDYSISASAKSKRKMPHRFNETVTRWKRFGALGLLPRALPYVVKPLIVGLLPEKLLKKLKGYPNDT